MATARGGYASAGASGLLDHGFAANLPGFPHDRRFAAKRLFQQPLLRPATCGFTLGSSSPLRGVATTTPVRVGSRGRRSRPHRPCEGSQPASTDLLCVGYTGPHRPYEGSQPHRGQLNAEHPGQVLIAPTRGRNSVSRTIWETCSAVLIAPTRDRNAAITALTFMSASGPHRPYEGSQPYRSARGARCARVLIAHTRGRNLTNPASARPWMAVLITPARGCNLDPAGLAIGRHLHKSLSPLGGSQWLTGDVHADWQHVGPSIRFMTGCERRGRGCWSRGRLLGVRPRRRGRWLGCRGSRPAMPGRRRWPTLAAARPIHPLSVA